MRRLSYLVLLFFCLIFRSHAQDTIHLLQYNLLNFGVENSYCNNTSNNILKKNSGLKSILEYSRPDIFSANEIGADSSIYKIILDSILLPINNSYKSGKYSNSSNADLISMIFFNSNKISLYSQKTITTDVRDINFYKFYYKLPSFPNNDTTFFSCIQAHLKAGNAASDANERAQETEVLMNFLNTNNIGSNVILMGDFNLYSSSEIAYQNLINHSNSSIRFYDPIYKSGSWSGNNTFSLYHTQSTRLTGNDCFASGGLNDRFDFIMCSYPILAGINKVAYIPSSYKTIGQDGSHFNKSVNSGSNSSVPDTIAEALYNVSDHLPISLSLKIEASKTGIRENSNLIFKICQFEDFLFITANSYKQIITQVQILNTLGQELYSTHNQLLRSESTIKIPISHLPKGIYLLKLQTSNSYFEIKKFQIK